MSEIGDFRKNNIPAGAKIRHWPRHSKRDSRGWSISRKTRPCS